MKHEVANALQATVLFLSLGAVTLAGALLNSRRGQARRVGMVLLIGATLWATASLTLPFYGPLWYPGILLLLVGLGGYTARPQMLEE